MTSPRAGAASRTVTLARQRYAVGARGTATIHAHLSRGGRRLVTRAGVLVATLSLKQTTAAGTTLIAAQRLKLRAPRSALGGRAA